MTIRRWSLVLLVTTVVFDEAPMCLREPAVQFADGVVGIDEISARGNVVRRTLPVYPPESIATKTSGVAVAMFSTDANGIVTNVDILQEPDAAIGAAVRDAVLTWTFSPVRISGRAEPYGLRSRLTFYFRITDGRGQVLNPDEMPGGPEIRPFTQLPPPPSAAPGVRRGAPPVAGGHGLPAHSAVDETGLQRLLATERAVLLDVRERRGFDLGHRDEAVNIPRTELAVRAAIELDVSQPIVIDCATVEPRECRSAHEILSVRFTRVLVTMSGRGQR